MGKKLQVVQGHAGPTEGAPEGATGVGPAKQRWTSSRKLDAVMSVLRGQSLDAVSRRFGVSLHELTSWRNKVLAGAELALKARVSDEMPDAEKKALLSKIGEITMDYEVLKEKVKKLENGVPFHLRR
jgi:transposase-like protein